MDHITIAKEAIPHIREILGDTFKYITDAHPEVKFFECNGDFILTDITFIATGAYADTIFVDSESITLETEEGAEQVLCAYNWIPDILDLTTESVAKLRPEIAGAVTLANQAAHKK